MQKRCHTQSCCKESGAAVDTVLLHLTPPTILPSLYFNAHAGKGHQRIGIPLITWAAIIGFAQIYVGCISHLDVLTGSLIGIGIGWLWSYVFMKYYRYILFANETLDKMPQLLCFWINFQRQVVC